MVTASSSITPCPFGSASSDPLCCFYLPSEKKVNFGINNWIFRDISTCFRLLAAHVDQIFGQRTKSERLPSHPPHPRPHTHAHIHTDITRWLNYKYFSGPDTKHLGCKWGACHHHWILNVCVCVCVRCILNTVWLFSSVISRHTPYYVKVAPAVAANGLPVVVSYGCSLLCGGVAHKGPSF